jgi:hypothetical protein
MTAPFYVDSCDCRLTINPGPWGVAIIVTEHGNGGTAITLTAEDATRVAAALILAAASAASHRNEQTVSASR